MNTRFNNEPLPFPTDAEIEAAKVTAKRERMYLSRDPVHEHPDCIRAAFAWLDAQRVVKKRPQTWWPLKSMIEGWAKRYVSTDDVIVAALLHPHIKGRYPDFHISARLTLPDQGRLKGLEVGIHPDYKLAMEMYHNTEFPL